jgi:hypothetical protein
VRLYLSSFRLGDHPEYLRALVGDGSRRTVVIANAMDDAPEEIRHAGVERELAALGELGFDAAELDLRDYFDDEQRLRRELARSTRLRSRAKLARPYIWRLIILIRFTLPSTAPELCSMVRSASTAS